MNQRYTVRRPDQERDELAAVIKMFKVTSQKVRSVPETHLSGGRRTREN
jgi:hypothetical protein